MGKVGVVFISGKTSSADSATVRVYGTPKPCRNSRRSDADERRSHMASSKTVPSMEEPLKDEMMRGADPASGTGWEPSNVAAARAIVKPGEAIAIRAGSGKVKAVNGPIIVGVRCPWNTARRWADAIRPDNTVFEAESVTGYPKMPKCARRPSAVRADHTWGACVATDV
jgi:hypothetical protein